MANDDAGPIDSNSFEVDWAITPKGPIVGPPGLPPGLDFNEFKEEMKTWSETFEAYGESPLSNLSALWSGEDPSIKGGPSKSSSSIDAKSPIVNASTDASDCSGPYIPSKECPAYTTTTGTGGTPKSISNCFGTGTCTDVTDLPEMSEDGGVISLEMKLIDVIYNMNANLRQKTSEEEEQNREQKRREQQLLSDLANMNPKHLENIEYEESE